MKAQEQIIAMENVLPRLPENAKCKRCKGRGEIRLPSHNTLFCRECYIGFCQTAVTRAMEKFGISEETRAHGRGFRWEGFSCLVGSSRISSGYRTRGLHVSLGIDDFSEASVDAVSDFASARNLPWAHYSLKEIFGWTVPEIRERSRRSICSLCGTLKRQLLNRLTAKEGYQVLVSGHNLDDEAGKAPRKYPAKPDSVFRKAISLSACRQGLRMPAKAETLIPAGVP